MFGGTILHTEIPSVRQVNDEVDFSVVVLPRCPRVERQEGVLFKRKHCQFVLCFAIYPFSVYGKSDAIFLLVVRLPRLGWDCSVLVVPVASGTSCEHEGASQAENEGLCRKPPEGLHQFPESCHAFLLSFTRTYGVKGISQRHGLTRNRTR